MQPIFRTEMLKDQSNTDLGVKILFGKVTYLVDLEIRNMLERDWNGNEDSTFKSSPWFTRH